MSRRYADRIAVDALPESTPGALRTGIGATGIGATGAGATGAGATGAGGFEVPQAFVWRRRRYRVRAVLQRWIEVGAWWRTSDAVDQEYQLWRVEAGAQYPPGSPAGHFDLCRHQGTGHWFLLRTFD